MPMMMNDYQALMQGAPAWANQPGMMEMVFGNQRYAVDPRRVLNQRFAGAENDLARWRGIDAMETQALRQLGVDQNAINSNINSYAYDGVAGTPIDLSRLGLNMGTKPAPLPQPGQQTQMQPTPTPMPNTRQWPFQAHSMQNAIYGNPFQQYGPNVMGGTVVGEPRGFRTLMPGMNPYAPQQGGLGQGMGSYGGMGKFGGQSSMQNSMQGAPEFGQPLRAHGGGGKKMAGGQPPSPR